MPAPEECQVIYQELATLETLKNEFDSAYEQAVKTGELETARTLKAEIQTKLEALKEKLNPLETLLALKEQYQSQRDILERVGVLERLSSGELGIKGIDNQEYPLPSYQEISQSVREAKEILKTKAKQGFTKLMLVPFGAKLDDLIAKYKAALLKHFTENKLFYTKKDQADPSEALIPITEDQFKKDKPVWVWEQYQEADINNKLVYFPKEYSENHQGKTKSEVLTQTNQGWQILLLEDMPNIPKEGEAKEPGGRKQIDNHGTSIRAYMEDPNQTTPSPTEYLKALQQDPQYQHESGLTPEDWLSYALTHLEETNQVIDDWQGQGKVSYNLGGYFPASGRVPDVYWSRDNRQASLDRRDPGNRDVYYGVRPAVRVKRLKFRL